jgi:hypothetical protein
LRPGRHVGPIPLLVLAFSNSFDVGEAAVSALVVQYAIVTLVQVDFNALLRLPQPSFFAALLQKSSIAAISWRCIIDLARCRRISAQVLR